MDIDQIKDLMRHLEESKLSKLVYKSGDTELQLEKEPTFRPARMQTASSELDASFVHELPLQGERGGAVRSDMAGTYVTSPMVGTFYGSPAPDQPSFVKVGDRVVEDTVVCIVEAMKVMNEVKAGIAGTVAEIIADNSQPVEFGSRLLRIV